LAVVEGKRKKERKGKSQRSSEMVVLPSKEMVSERVEGKAESKYLPMISTLSFCQTATQE